MAYCTSVPWDATLVVGGGNSTALGPGAAVLPPGVREDGLTCSVRLMESQRGRKNRLT